MKANFLKAFAAAVICLSITSVHANELRCRQMKLVAPFGAGGANDVAARVIAKGLEPTLKMSVIIENRPGAAGNVGTQYVIGSEADGCTLLVHGTAVGFYPHMFKQLGFNPLTDLTAVGSIGVTPTVIVTNNKKISNLQELLAWSKITPAGLSYGSAGVGVINHLALEEIANRTKTNLVHVPYRGGSGATQDAVTGQLHFATLTLASVSQFVDSGAVNLIAVLQPKPTTLAPGAATIATQGFPDMNAGHHLVVLAPRRTPSDTIEMLSNALEQVVSDPANRKSFESVGIEPVPIKAQATQDLIRKTGEEWAPVIKRLNLQL